MTGLCLDILGACVLASAVLVDRPQHYVATQDRRATQAAMEGIYVDLDFEHARQVGDAQLGIALLAIGFAGQLVGVLIDATTTWGAALVYPLGLFIAAVALLYRGIGGVRPSDSCT